MYLARDFRSIARKALKGFWGLSVGVTLVASLLGGMSGGSSSTATIQQLTDRTSDSETIYFSDTLNALFASPTFYAILTVAMTFFTILSILYLLIGGAVELGLNRYSIDLVTRQNQPAFGTLFSRFSFWGKAFGLRFMTSVHHPRHRGKLSLRARALPDGGKPGHRRYGSDCPLEGADAWQQGTLVLPAIQLHRLVSAVYAYARHWNPVGRSLSENRRDRVLSGRYEPRERHAAPGWKRRSLNERFPVKTKTAGMFFPAVYFLMLSL